MTKPITILLAWAFVACGGDGYPTAPTMTHEPHELHIVGRTYLNGEPVGGVRLVFVWNMVGDTLAKAISGADGSYVLGPTCLCQTGAVASRVSLTATFSYEGRNFNDTRATPRCTEERQTIDISCDPAEGGGCGPPYTANCPPGWREVCGLGPDGKEICTCRTY